MKLLLSQINSQNNMLRTLFTNIILVADSNPTIKDKIIYICTIIGSIAPFVYIAEGINLWFINNTRFFTFMIMAIIVNLFVGAWFHHKNKSFNWGQLLARNSLMVANIFVSYLVLEMIRLSGGENMTTEMFKIIIQIATLLYPGAKILKNMYILSNKQFPPKFVMERLYRFEKTGDINELYNKEKES